jgi:hypothetical protein
MHLPAAHMPTLNAEGAQRIGPHSTVWPRFSAQSIERTGRAISGVLDA